MSERRTVWVETEHHDTDLMSVVRRLMCDGFTGQIVLNCNTGRVMSVVQREKNVERVPERTERKDFVDTVRV
jgi:hypothetical protein